MKWNRIPEGWVSGKYLAEKVHAPGPRGYDWYLTHGDDWDYGVCGTLAEAKERAEKHAAANN